MSPRPIIFLATRYNASGGAPLMARRLAAAAREANFNAEMWAIYSVEPDVPTDVARCFGSSAPKRQWHLAFYIWRCVRALWAAKPQAIYGFHPLANVLLGFVGTLMRCPHKIAGQHNPPTSQSLPFKYLDMLCGTLGLYSGNIAVSKTVAASYGHYPAAYKKQLQVITNGVPWRASDAPATTARAAFNLPATAKLIGTTGRIEAQKNHEFLLHLLQADAELHLAIAGGGADTETFKAQVTTLGLAARVHLLGRVAQEKIPLFIRALDVFVFPSRYEGFGLALVEAMQNNIPCVTAELDVFADILQTTSNTPCGICLPTTQAAVPQWLAAINQLCADTAYRTQLTDAAHAHARDFEFSKMISAYLAMLT